jgi:hypothetical protein
MREELKRVPDRQRTQREKSLNDSREWAIFHWQRNSIVNARDPGERSFIGDGSELFRHEWPELSLY